MSQIPAGELQHGVRGSSIPFQAAPFGRPSVTTQSTTRFHSQRLETQTRFVLENLGLLTCGPWRFSEMTTRGITFCLCWACSLPSWSCRDCGQRHWDLCPPESGATAPSILGRGLSLPSATPPNSPGAPGSRLPPGQAEGLGLGCGGPLGRSVSELHIHAGNHGLVLEIISFPGI